MISTNQIQGALDDHGKKKFTQISIHYSEKINEFNEHFKNLVLSTIKNFELLEEFIDTDDMKYDDLKLKSSKTFGNYSSSKDKGPEYNVRSKHTKVNNGFDNDFPNPMSFVGTTLESDNPADWNFGIVDTSITNDDPHYSASEDIPFETNKIIQKPTKRGRPPGPRPPKSDTPSKKQQINAVKSQENTSSNTGNTNANEELLNNIKQEFDMETESSTNPNFVKSNKISAGSAIIKSEQILDANGNVKTVREYKCEWCQKIFAYKQNMDTHILTKHQKTFPFKCDQCTYMTADKQHLKKHIKRIHDNIKDFECTEYLCDEFGMVRKCEYATSGKGELKRHIKAVHDKIKDAVCDECGYATSEKADLRKHIQNKHPKPEDMMDEPNDWLNS